jgi:hypothetical protein
MFWFFSPKILVYLDTEQFMRKVDKIAKNIEPWKLTFP